MSLFSIAAALLIAATLLVLSPVEFTCWLTFGIAILLYAAWREENRRQFAFLACGLLLAAAFVMPWVNHLIAAVTPRTLDSFFGLLDRGCSVAFFRWVNGHLALRLTLIMVYTSLTFFICVSFLLSDRRGSFLRCILLAALASPVFYLILPAVGPGHLGDPAAPRNCMPSLHIAWTLLCVAFITPRLRWIGLPYILLMMTAVIGIGEHYLIDIVAALPFAYAVVATEEAITRRVRRAVRTAAPEPVAVER